MKAPLLRFLPALRILALAVFTVSHFLTATASEKPNIIIIFTDDQGWADLGVQGIVDDIKTPHLDALANGGVRCTSGYITAPQCSPSRAGLITGRYQQRFGVDAIADMPLSLDEVTIADRMKEAGYVTGQVGKWHLQPAFHAKRWIMQHPDAVVQDPKSHIGRNIADKYRLQYDAGSRGFDEFYQNAPHWYSEDNWANYRLDGSNLDPKGEYVSENEGCRLEVESRAALAFIERNHDKPFFLYLAYSGPHTPLYISKANDGRFPGEMKERRRAALSMMATMDDGVGEIMATLERHGIADNTLIFFTSDNGAPLKMTMEDSELTWENKSGFRKQNDPGGWDGSLNAPLNGEKGMLTEGGIRVPFFAYWKNVLPAGKVYDHPVSALDFAATSMAVAGMEPPETFDGKNLIPYLSGEKSGAPHEALYWRFWKQSAIRVGDWKFMYLGDGGEFLFNLTEDPGEEINLAEELPELARELKMKLREWTLTLKPKGLPKNGIQRERGWYDFYLGHESQK